jgi:predicted dehydrogenase
MPPCNIAIIGCGKIAGAYFTGIQAYPHLRVAACADLDVELARRVAAEHQVPFAGRVDEVITRPEIDLVLNLTIPAAHATINRQALAAGKHVYCEKPFALSAADTLAVVEEARRAGLRVGSAPDTFLGAGLQTARLVLDRGDIGRPVAAVGFLTGRGHESWHPNPAFYYKPGGGPMWDMGPYYVTALVHLLGPVRRVSALTRTTFPTRTITSEPRRGEIVTVEVPTHYSVSLEFTSGVIATLVMSFDVHRYPLPNLVVYGSEGTLRVPDPNRFDEAVEFSPLGAKDYTPVPLTHALGRGRGSGVADLASALLAGRPHRAGGELAHHVIEILEAADRSGREGMHITVRSSCERPAPLPADLPAHAFDA